MIGVFDAPASAALSTHSMHQFRTVTALVPRIVVVAAGSAYAMACVAAGVRVGAGEVAAVRLADRRTGLHRETVVCAEWTPSSCAHFDPFAPAGGCARAHEFAIDAPRAEG